MERQIGFNPELGAALRAARAKAGYTQARVAQLALVTRNWLDACEAGRSFQPDYDRLKRVARVYGMKPSELLRLAHYDVGPSVDEEDVFTAVEEATKVIRKLAMIDRQKAREVANNLSRELSLVLA